MPYQDRHVERLNPVMFDDEDEDRDRDGGLPKAEKALMVTVVVFGLVAIIAAIVISIV